MVTFISCAIIFAIAATWIRKQENDIRRLTEENERKDQIIQEMSIEEHLTQISRVQTDQGHTLHTLVWKVDSLYRGLYGDPNNKTEGLIDRQERDEQRIDKLERSSVASKAKTLGMFAAGGAILFEVYSQIKSFFHS